MKVLIVGSPNLDNYYKLVEVAIIYAQPKIAKEKIKRIVCFDNLVKKWAEDNYFKIKKFDIDWLNLEAEGAIIRENSRGEYNAAAGFQRNEAAAKYANALIAIYKDGDKSLEHLIELMQKMKPKKKVVVYEVD
jgi:hypothetical protein